MLMRGLRTLRNLPGLAVAKAAYRRKFLAYQASGQPPADAEKALLLANWASCGTLPKDLSRRSAVPFDSLAGFSDDIFAGLDVADAVRAVARDGYYVAPKVIASDVVSALGEFLNVAPADSRDSGVTRWMKPETIIQCGAFRKLLSESYPARVAAAYFGGAPMIMSIAMWRSFASASPQSASAQKFHYDGDRPLFLKMFVYLVDVSPANGPHVYVPRTHGQKPRWLLSGDRLSDAEVARRYPRDTWAQICGPKGTFFFADTQGFHKGLNVSAGSRSIVQINFSSDRFGPVYPTIGRVEESPADIRQLVRANQRYFTELFTG